MKIYLRFISAALLLCLLGTSVGVRANEPVIGVVSGNFAPQIIVGDVTGIISACEGTASLSPAVQQFTVSASGLSEGVTITAPVGFEISLAADGTYGSGLVLTQISGLIPQVTVYVRSSALAGAGNISGNIQLSSSGITQLAMVSGHINALPVVSAVSNQTKQNGQLTDAIAFTGTAGSYTWTNDNPSIGLPASGSGNIDKFTAINTGTVPVTANITVTPTPASYAYVSNNDLNGVALINIAANRQEQLITQGIPPNSSPLRVLLSPDKSLLYMANAGTNTISVISTATNKVIATFPANPEPTGMTMSPDGSRLYLTDYSHQQFTVINTATQAIVRTNILVGHAYDMAISANGKKLYIVNTDPDILQFYDIATNIFEYGIAITGTPNSIVISPDNKTLYIANFSSHDIAVVDIAGRFIAYRIDVASSPNCMAISPDGARLYVSSGDGTKVTVINTATRDIITTIDAGTGQMGVTISSDGSKVYVVNALSGYIYVIDAATNTLDRKIPMQPGGFFMAILSDNPCSGQPITFSITVNPSPVVVPPVPGEAVVIPNSFSPNGDGANDTWVIKNISGYPHNTVEIFNRYGQRLFRSNGYGVAWDGEVNGKPLPPGTYYYIVNLKDGSKSLSGNVTIFR